MSMTQGGPGNPTGPGTTPAVHSPGDLAFDPEEEKWPTELDHDDGEPVNMPASYPTGEPLPEPKPTEGPDDQVDEEENDADDADLIQDA
jgi:hypothetical protein